MSIVTEIEGAIAKRTPEEQRQIARRLGERLLDDESPENLGVIDEGAMVPPSVAARHPQTGAPSFPDLLPRGRKDPNRGSRSRLGWTAKPERPKPRLAMNPPIAPGEILREEHLQPVGISQNAMARAITRRSNKTRPDPII